MRREVRVKPAFADQYPTLARDRWYTAAAVAGLVKGTIINREGSEARLPERVLEPAHFEFRGGAPRHGSWAGLHTRRADRHPILAGTMA